MGCRWEGDVDGAQVPSPPSNLGAAGPFRVVSVPEETSRLQERGPNPKDLIGVTKVPLSLVPASSLIYEALAFQDGARKYGPFNWRDNKVVASIYVDACLRHIFSWQDGEELSSDAKIPHLGHAKACLGILIDALETGNLVDDRPTAGTASAILEKWKKERVK
jgi:hypothetical protein